MRGIQVFSNPVTYRDVYLLLKQGPAGQLQGMFVILIVIYELAIHGMIV